MASRCTACLCRLVDDGAVPAVRLGGQRRLMDRAAALRRQETETQRWRAECARLRQQLAHLHAVSAENVRLRRQLAAAQHAEQAHLARMDELERHVRELYARCDAMAQPSTSVRRCLSANASPRGSRIARPASPRPASPRTAPLSTSTRVPSRVDCFDTQRPSSPRSQSRHQARLCAQALSAHCAHSDDGESTSSSSSIETASLPLSEESALCGGRAPLPPLPPLSSPMSYEAHVGGGTVPSHRHRSRRRRRRAPPTEVIACAPLPLPVTTANSDARYRQNSAQWRSDAGLESLHEDRQ